MIYNEEPDMINLHYRTMQKMYFFFYLRTIEDTIPFQSRSLGTNEHLYLYLSEPIITLHKVKQLA